MKLFEKRRVKQLLWVLMTFSVGILAAVGYFRFMAHGLIAHYYNNIDWCDSPYKTVRDVTICLQAGRISTYSVEWTGVLYIPESGEYQFSTTSDDGSWIFLDDVLIVDNGGNHAIQKQIGTAFLNKGFHAITIRFFQEYGDASLQISWKKPGKTWESIPVTALFLEKPNEFMFHVGLYIRYMYVLLKNLCFFGPLIFVVIGTFTHRYRIKKTFFHELNSQQTQREFYGICFIAVLHILYYLYGERNFWSVNTLSVYLFCLCLIALKRDFFWGFYRKNMRTIDTVLLFLAICWYLYWYWQAGGLRDSLPDWRGWWDQGQYYQMLEHLANGTFKVGHYTYGLGYPLLGTLFYKVYSADALFPVNLLCWIITIVYAKKIFDAVLDKSLSFSITLLLIVNPYLVEYVKVSWNSTVTLAAYTYSLHILIKRRRGIWDYFFWGLASGLAFAARYVDIVLFVPMGIYFLIHEIRLKRITTFLPGVIMSVIIASAVFYSHHYYLGGFFNNPYQSHGHRNDEYSDGDIEYYVNRTKIPKSFVHFASMFFSDKDFVGEQYTQHKNLREAILQKNILFLFAPLGLFLLCQKNSEIKQKLLIVLGGIIPFMLIYCAHPGTTPGNLIYSSAHYFKTLIPIMTLGGGVYFSELTGSEDSFLKLVQWTSLLILVYIGFVYAVILMTRLHPELLMQ